MGYENPAVHDGGQAGGRCRVPERDMCGGRGYDRGRPDRGPGAAFAVGESATAGGLPLGQSDWDGALPGATRAGGAAGSIETLHLLADVEHHRRLAGSS